MTIFVSLAAYREAEIRTTILSAIANAKNPEDIYFGVFAQADDDEFIDVSDIPNVRQERVLASEAKGAGYARHRAEQLYEGEDYFLQIDSHCIFMKNWDDGLVKWHRMIQKETGRDKIILSSWAMPYRYEDGELVLNSTITHAWHWKGTIRPHYNTIVPYNGIWTAYRVPMDDEYHESFCVLGGLIFSTGNLVAEVPSDPRISWHGEEILYTLRAYTRGWRVYSIKDAYIYHHYDRDLKRIWDDNANWRKFNHESITTSYKILSLNEDSIYGIGDISEYMEYQQRTNTDMLKEATKKWRA
jgi:hypothetical protein